MSEGIGKYYITASVSHLACRIIAFLSFRDPCLKNIFHSCCLTGFLCSGNEVQVIGGILIMKEDKPYLYIRSCRRLTSIFRCRGG